MLLGTWNHERIRKYIADKGGTVIDIQWVLFGPGWFAGNQNVAIYKIRYQDRNKNEHHAYCKTGILSGVYLTEDKIVKTTKPQPQNGVLLEVSLEEENRRFKEEIRRLRAER